jgi:16S rRNA C1402 N4-methylase RsmH
MNLEFKNLLERINGDPERAAGIIFELGLSSDDLQDHAKTGRVFDVINYLMKEDNPSHVIRKLTINKPGTDKIDHIWTYYGVLHQAREAKAKFEEVDKKSIETESKLAFGNPTPADFVLAGVISKERMEAERQFNSLQEELSYF